MIRYNRYWHLVKLDYLLNINMSQSLSTKSRMDREEICQISQLVHYNLYAIKTLRSMRQAYHDIHSHLLSFLLKNGSPGVSYQASDTWPSPAGS